jgi:hypothetical protein
MNAKQTLIALVIAATAPFAAQAESRFGEGYPTAMVDTAGTATRAEVRAEFLANSGTGQRFGEAYPVATETAGSVLTREEVRADYLAMNRNGQRFGEAYPAHVYGSTTSHTGGMQANVR